MKSRTALLLCSTALMVTFGATGYATRAEASPATVPAAQSYADLLAPIPNAVGALRADNAAQAFRPRARIQLAQYHHHHHHHHHGDAAGAIIGGIIGGALGGALAPPPPPPDYYYRHCYWTWGRAYWNGYRWVHPRERVCN
jgi:hypothetical protein